MEGGGGWGVQRWGMKDEGWRVGVKDAGVENGVCRGGGEG